MHTHERLTVNTKYGPITFIPTGLNRGTFRTTRENLGSEDEIDQRLVVNNVDAEVTYYVERTGPGAPFGMSLTKSGNPDYCAQTFHKAGSAWDRNRELSSSARNKIIAELDAQANKLAANVPAYFVNAERNNLHESINYKLQAIRDKRQEIEKLEAEIETLELRIENLNIPS